MQLKIKVKQGTVPAERFTKRSELDDIAASLEVVLPEQTQLVFFGQFPPADLSLMWQKTDAYGAPVGNIKSWTKEGGWA